MSNVYFRILSVCVISVVTVLLVMAPVRACADSATPLARTKININKADGAALQKLPGIGRAKAEAIIAGRPYARIEDIMKVKGIKQKTFERLQDQIDVR
ncbi:MAG: helix-hairpin-helix domain-containing protein [Smithellaceae bacterium]